MHAISLKRLTPRWLHICGTKFKEMMQHCLIHMHAISLKRLTPRWLHICATRTVTDPLSLYLR